MAVRRPLRPGPAAGAARRRRRRSAATAWPGRRPPRRAQWVALAPGRPAAPAPPAAASRGSRIGSPPGLRASSANSFGPGGSGSPGRITHSPRESARARPISRPPSSNCTSAPGAALPAVTSVPRAPTRATWNRGASGRATRGAGSAGVGRAMGGGRAEATGVANGAAAMDGGSAPGLGPKRGKASGTISQAVPIAATAISPPRPMRPSLVASVMNSLTRRECCLAASACYRGRGRRQMNSSGAARSGRRRTAPLQFEPCRGYAAARNARGWAGHGRRVAAEGAGMGWLDPAGPLVGRGADRPVLVERRDRQHPDPHAFRLRGADPGAVPPSLGLPGGRRPPASAASCAPRSRRCGTWRISAGRSRTARSATTPPAAGWCWGCWACCWRSR